MSALRKAGVWLGLIEDEDDEAYEDRSYRDPGRAQARDRSGRRYGRVRDEFSDEFAEEEEVEAAPLPRARAATREPERLTRRRAEREAEASVRSITRDTDVSYPTRDSLALAPRARPEPVAEPEEDRRYQITTLHPTTYREARTIGEHFRDGTPVIMNLTEMDEADARRLVDFGAGLAFGLRGNMERVTNRVFLLSPANVQVTAEDKAKIAEGEFFQHR